MKEEKGKVSKQKKVIVIVCYVHPSSDTSDWPIGYFSFELFCC